MKKILGLFFGLILSMPVFAAIPGDYQIITPDDTATYPETLSGYTKLVVDGTLDWTEIPPSGSGASYYRYKLYPEDNVAVAPSISDQLSRYGINSSNTGVGFLVYYSSSGGGTFIGVRDPSKFSSASAAKVYFTNNPMIVLYKKSSNPDNNEFRAVRRVVDGALGYYCESGTNADTFVPAFGMTTSTPVSRCPVGQVERTYTSATGTVTQNGTPTPTNPIEPTFYTQGNMVLRKVGDYADSYDATTGKITRRIGVKVLDGTENWKSSSAANVYYFGLTGSARTAKIGLPSTHYIGSSDANADMPDDSIKQTTMSSIKDMGTINVRQTSVESLSGFKTFLAQQYDNGTPVKIYYVLATETTEDWPAEQCESSSPIKIATTKYNNTAFQPVLTALNNAVTTIKDVVANTINQATAVSNLQSGKQTMPDSTATNGTCPNYRQCLLVEDESGTPHWYEIMDPFYNLFSAVIPNNVSTDSVTSQNGVPDTYTQLEYIESEGTQYINTGISMDYQNGMIINAVIEGVNHDRGVVFGFDQDYTGTFVGARDNKFYMANGGTNVSDSLKVEVVATWTPRNNRMYMSGTIDGQAVTEYGYTRSLTTNIYLFKGNGWNQSNSYWVGRIYALSIIDNGALVRNFVPVRRNSDQLVGMYDLVRGVFYGNAESQTVNFAAGPVVPNQKASWSMGFGANPPLDARYMVNGSAICNATLSAANTAATSSQMSANNWTSVGSNCWCSIDMVTELNNNNISTGKNIWVWLEVPSGETCAADCASNCVATMASGAAADKPFRQAMTGI